MDLQKKKAELEQDIEATKVRFSQLVGAVSIINEQIAETSPAIVTETETDGIKN